MHTPHTGMPATAVLADDCDRCLQHARNPIEGLDDGNIRRLLQQEGVAPTTNDAIARNHIDSIMQQAERINRIKRHIVNGPTA